PIAVVASASLSGSNTITWCTMLEVPGSTSYEVMNASAVTWGSATKQRNSFASVPFGRGVNAVGIVIVASGASMCGGAIPIGGVSLGSPIGAPFAAHVPSVVISASLSQRP